MKNLPGQLYKSFILLLFLLFAAGSAYCYETIILHYPDRDWVPVSYERKTEEEEIIAKFVPRYDDKVNWTEMLIFHSYKWAKKSNEKADSFIETLMGNNYDKFGRDLKPEKIKTDPEDAIVVWCSTKTTKEGPPQCEIMRVTNGAESLMSVQYINRDILNFSQRRKVWQPIIENAVVYYSYFRWNRIMNKALCVEL